MSPKNAKQAAADLRAKQERASRQIKEAQARNAHAMISGEMDAGSIPGGSVLEIAEKAVTPDGIEVAVTIYEASFGGRTKRTIMSGEARGWLRDQRAAWKVASGKAHDRSKALARLARMRERMEEALADIGSSLSDDECDLFAQAIGSIGAIICATNE